MPGLGKKLKEKFIGTGIPVEEKRKYIDQKTGEERPYPPNSSVDIFQLNMCPFNENEIDKRFFYKKGQPNEELIERYQTVLEESEKIFGKGNVRIYVVGGVMGKRSKLEYGSDLDIFVEVIKGNLLSEDHIRETSGEDGSYANQITKAVNKGSLPENSKSFEFTDIIVDNHAPYAYWPWGIPEEVHYSYCLTDGKYYAFREHDSDRIERKYSR